MTTKLANWPAPSNISALCTTRQEGFSQAPYEFNNLALHVGDNETDVLKNRSHLVKSLALLADPFWLTQTHSVECVIAGPKASTEADAAISHSPAHPLVVLTADCLSITLCNTKGTEIAAIHAGWKGLCNGIIENTIKKMNTKPEHLLAWLGPAICQNCYEVGEEVYQAFITKHPSCHIAFKAHHKKWLLSLSKIAEIILNLEGVNSVWPSGLCTFEMDNDFYSYRKAAQTGRIGTLIWFNDNT